MRRSVAQAPGAEPKRLRDDVRSIAQLNMLHNLAAALNMLGDDLLESMRAVPMIAGDEVVGVLVLSKLGYAQFDEDDRRLLEVLASHASVAFQTARLLEAERREARVSGALLRLSQAMTSEHTVGEVFQRAIETVPTIVPCIAAAASTRHDEPGGFRAARVLALRAHVTKPLSEI